MLRLQGLGPLKKIYWRDLKPGMVYLGGVNIQGGPPLELMNYPVLTAHLLHDLDTKYKFLSNKQILVAETRRIAPDTFNRQTMSAIRKLKTLNELRNIYHHEKEILQKTHPSLLATKTEKIVYSDAIIGNQGNLDSFNTFSYRPSLQPPSLLYHSHHEIRFTDLFTGKIDNTYQLPYDWPLQMHIAIDCSSSMNERGFLSSSVEAINFSLHYLSQLFTNIELFTYTFSEKCRAVPFPISGKEVRSKDSLYEEVFKKVLHHRDREYRNIFLIITDGKGMDFSNTLAMAPRLQKYQIDFIQIIIYNPEIFGLKVSLAHITKWQKMANTAGGNQILLPPTVLKISLLEIIDSYLGALYGCATENFKPTSPMALGNAMVSLAKRKNRR